MLDAPAVVLRLLRGEGKEQLILENNLHLIQNRGIDALSIRVRVGYLQFLDEELGRQPKAEEYQARHVG